MTDRTAPGTAPGSAPRVLFVVHHPLDPNAGVSGATLQLADALRGRGCIVEYFTYDEAFGGGHGGVGRMLAFPWKVAQFLKANASRFDVIDATTGDLWRWLAAGRPSGGAARVVTRSHGLEHWAHNVRVERAKRGEWTLSWKYGIYHGGWRLREVERTLSLSDGVVFLNERNRRWAVASLRIDPARTTVAPNALPPSLLSLPAPAPRLIGAPLEIAVLGAWIPSKGSRVIAAAAHALESRGVDVRWHLLGTHIDKSTIAGEFPIGAARTLRVSPRYDRQALPRLLASAQLFASGSWSEGFNMSLVETMACGLAPVTASVGAADDWVTPSTGVLLNETVTGEERARAIAELAVSADLDAMRIAAQRSVQSLTWERVADDTLAYYRSLTPR
jgi:glycosyltransferase involved in cell wall biosynthesis